MENLPTNQMGINNRLYTGGIMSIVDFIWLWWSRIITMLILIGLICALICSSSGKESFVEGMKFKALNKARENLRRLI